MLAFAIEETVNDTGAAHLEQARAKRAARTMKTHVDIVDTRIKGAGDAFTRLLEQISAPDDFGIVRPERWQEAIETVAYGSLHLRVRNDFCFCEFGEFLRINGGFVFTAARSLSVKVGNCRRQHSGEPSLDRTHVPQVPSPLDRAKHETLKNFLRLLTPPHTADEETQHIFVAIHQGPAHCFIHRSQRLLGPVSFIGPIFDHGKPRSASAPIPEKGPSLPVKRSQAVVSLRHVRGSPLIAAKEPESNMSSSQKKKISKSEYKQQLRALQIELVKIQRQVIAHGERVLIIFEGRDAAGKDGVIKRVREHMSPRETRVVALGKPSDRDTRSWYFRRYSEQLPADEEIALFNRSWYNRAGVERVMGFADKEEVADFFSNVAQFEEMLARDGTTLLKYYLDIDRKEQARRLEARRTDPLKQWKISPIDAAALEKWNDYSKARDEMLTRTDFAYAPWIAVRANDKRAARLNIIRHILQSIACPAVDRRLARPDPSVILPVAELGIGRLAP